MNKFLISIFIFAILAVPALSLAQDTNFQIIPCGQSDETTGEIKNPCDDFKDLMALVNNVIKFTLVYLALPLAAIMFAFAGFKLVTSGGSTEARGQAKRIFWNTALGLMLAVGAWLIVSTILAILGYDGSWIGLKVEL
ncbi:MAG TPA: hypothetical protein VJC14_00845 [Candidatus Paceibacterota bacterium]